jgi:hypothetical protein
MILEFNGFLRGIFDSCCRSSVQVGYHTFCNFRERDRPHRAGRPQHLNFDMAISEKFDFVVSARASNGNHNGIAHAFKVELDSCILEPCNKLKQLL